MLALAFTLVLAQTSTPLAAPGPDGLSAGDWSGIQAAYEAGRHSVRSAPEGHRASNPGQRWRSVFDGRGVVVTPDAGGWTWGLELERYGFAGHEIAVEEPASVTPGGQRLAYDWDATLEEWYVNDTRGLEHGYTVHRRPAAGHGPLTFTLAVRGGLRPDVSDDGRDVSFLDDDGATVLTYAGLHVFDAAGDSLTARFEVGGYRLRLLIDESGATYPLTIDPVAQQAYLKASNTDAGDRLGFSVAVSGDTVVIGAIAEDSNASGVDGDGSDNSLGDSGAAYVFVDTGSGWSQQAYLKAPAPDNDDWFGYSVAISGDTLVVGANQEDSGLAVDPSDDSLADSGAAYVFVRNGTTWSQEAYLKASNLEAGDNFGNAVSISGDTIAVGAILEDGSSEGVNGDENNDHNLSAGAVYVFTRSGTTWTQQAYVKSSDIDTTDVFGSSVSISGDTLVVGAYLEDSNATGVNGDDGNDSASAAGAAYVFVRSGTTWSQEAYLKASNAQTQDQFGTAVSVSGDTIVVGALNEDSNATGVNGDESDNSTFFSGAAYVFVRSGTTWTQEAYLKASNTDSSDRFGRSVSVSGDSIVVGATFESSSATGIDGDESDNSAGSSGAAYLFTRSGTTWTQEAYMKASNTDADDWFGYSVAIDGIRVAVSSVDEDSMATGIGGDEADDSATDAGAVYILESGVSFPNEILPAALMSDPVLADTGGNTGIGPAINDPAEPFALTLDCSGMATTGLYVIVMRTGHLPSPASSSFGDIWISGLKLIKSAGPHAQNAVQWGPITLPNDAVLVGIEYTSQGFCSQSPSGSRVSNGLVQTIGQ